MRDPNSCPHTRKLWGYKPGITMYHAIEALFCVECGTIFEERSGSSSYPRIKERKEYQDKLMAAGDND